MRIGVVICSSADLPKEFIQEHDINIMPITLFLNGSDEKLVDVRDSVETQNFYTRFRQERTMYGRTESYSIKQIRDWFLDELVLKYDRVLVLTLMGSRSPVFKNATQASFEILKGYREVRKKAGISGSFSLRVLDTGNLFTGEAVIAHEALRLLRKEKLPFSELRKRLEELIQYTHGYQIPNDLYHLRNNGRKRGDKTLPLYRYALAKALKINPITTSNRSDTAVFDKAKGFNAALEKLFEHTKKQVSLGLRAPVVCMSFAGDLEEIKQRAEYQSLIEYLTKHGIDSTLAVMSTSAGINLGPGTFSLAFATMEHV